MCSSGVDGTGHGTGQGNGNGVGSVDGGFGEPAFAAPVEAEGALAGLACLAGLDVRALCDDECLGLFDALEMADRWFHSARFSLLAELHARNLTDTRLGHVVANEAVWRHGVDNRRVRRDVTTANTLRRLPDIAAALADGTVSVDRVREVCRHLNDRTIDTFEAIQDELLDLIRAQSTWSVYCRDIAQLASYADPDGTEPPKPRNHASITRSGDTLAATIDLYGPESVGFAERVNTEADRLYRQAVTDHGIDPTLEIPPRSELLAQAFINLIAHGATNTTNHTGAIAPTADVSIVLDVDEHTVTDLFHNGTLLPGPTAEGPIDSSARATDLTGNRLRWSGSEWEMLTCDPTIAWIITTAGGHPVACKSSERHASRAQRRGLTIRDGGCVFPGCDAPAAWCDAHHIVAHSHHGPTDIRNLVLLCRHHHGVIHRDGWTMTANPDPRPGEGHATITTPTGAVLHTTHHTPPNRRQPEPA